jgi:Mg2+-importing ATPase
MSYTQTLAQLNPEEIASKYYSDLKKGLSPTLYEKNLEKHGLNELQKNKVSILRIFFEQFNIFILLLIFSIFLSIYNKEYFDALFILGFILLDLILGTFQETKAQKVISKLSELASYKTIVLRSGMKQTVSHYELVPGDIVYLKSGDLVPADIKLISSNELFVDESIFSGNSTPIFKNYEILKNSKNVEEQVVYSGSHVLKGKGEGIVFATGFQTKIGEVTLKNQKLLRKSKKQGNLSINEIESKKISEFIFKVVSITLFLSVIYQYFFDLSDFTNYLIFAITLGISVTPEALPLIITYSLSKGAEKLYKNKLLVKKLSSIEDLGAIEVLCTDKTGTLTENSLKISGHISLNSADVLKLGYFTVSKNLGTDSFDNAILTDTNLKLSYKSVKEIPFDPKLKISGKVIFFRDKYLLIYKGAYESIMKFNHISEEDRSRLREFNLKETSKGRRVLVLAFKYFPKLDKDISLYESKMHIGGAISFEDPLKFSVYESIKHADELNIDIRILSGDSKETCFYTAEKVGIISSIEEVVSYEDLVKLPRSDKETIILKTKVFSGLTPEGKVEIITILKQKFNVGYLGEGVNDSGALQVANLGIAVSNSCDIAKASADVIITKKSLGVLIEGIRLGRSIFYNISKYIKITFSADFGNYFAMLMTSLVSSFLPLKPIQVLLLTFMSDVPLLAVASDNVDKERLASPIKSEFGKLAKVFISLGLLSSLFDFLVFFYFYNSGEKILQSSWFLVSVLTEILVIFSLRSERFFLKASTPSKVIVITSFLMFTTALSLIYVPFLGERFNFVPLSWFHLGVVFGVSLIYFSCSEILKLFLYRQKLAS